MIIKGNQRGFGQALARHLMNAQENDHIELHDMRGFASTDLAGAFHEVETSAIGTKCKQPFFHVSLNPPPGYNPTIEEFERAVDLIEEKIPALKEQARNITFHEKQGRRHCHVVWSRIDERGPAVQLSHTKEKLKDVSRAMYATMGIEAPAGIRDRSKADPLNYDIGIWQQAKRLGEDPRDLKKIVQEAWTHSDDRASFERALEQNGLFLARGDRRGYVLVDHRGEALSLTRYANLGTRDLKARLGGPGHLPTVDQVRSGLRHRMTAAAERRGEIMRDRHKKEFQPLADEHQKMKAAHRQERQTVDREQAERWKRESQGRADRLRKGIMGWWDRVSGKRGRISEQNAREVAANKVRDRAGRHAVVERQMQERGELQSRIVQMRERHRSDRQHHRAELALMLSMMNDAARENFTEHTDEIAERRKPRTPAQTRRDRAEKRGTMPRITDSDRMRSRRDRNGDTGRTGEPSPGTGAGIDARADFSAVDGRDAGTGETTPENEQAPHGHPEAAQQGDSAQTPESTPEPSRFPTGSGAPETSWTPQQRKAAIEAEREAREARERQERERSNDNDPGREMT